MKTISQPFAVTIAASPNVGVEADWLARCTNASRWHKFDRGSTLTSFDKYPVVGYDSLGPEGAYGGTTASSYNKDTHLNYLPPNNWACEIDWPGKYSDSPAALASGSGCLRVARPSGTNEASPQFMWWFGEPRGAVTFGAGQKFYLQWRQRFSQGFINTVLTSGGDPQAGIKQMYLVGGFDPSDGHNLGNHEDNSMQFVVTTVYQYRMHELMCDWTGVSSGNVGGSCPLWATSASAGEQDYTQNARPPTRDVTSLTGCNCAHTMWSSNPMPNPPPGCFRFWPDEWMTFKLLVDLTGCGPEQPEAWNYPAGHPLAGQLSGRYRWQGSAVKLWGGRQGQPLELVIDWHPGVPGYFALDAGERNDIRYGKLMINNQTTGLDPSSVPVSMPTWYDQLILSTNDIPDPT